MGGPGVSIRRAGKDDVEGLLQCLGSAFEPYRGSYTIEAFKDTVLSADSIRQRLAEMSVFVAVGERGDIRGTIGYKLADSAEGHIRGMAVRPDQLGSRVAQQLLDTVEAELRQQGCSRISLDTTAPLARAIRFYERNGFRFSGTVRDFFGMELFEYVKELT